MTKCSNNSISLFIATSAWTFRLIVGSYRLYHVTTSIRVSNTRPQISNCMSNAWPQIAGQANTFSFRIASTDPPPPLKQIHLPIHYTIYFILLWGRSLSSSTMKSLTKIEDLLAKGVHTNRYRLTSAGLTVLSPSSSCEHSQVLQWLVSGHTYSHSTMKRIDKHSSLYTSGKTKIAPNDCHTIWSFLSCHRTNISSMSFGRFSSLCILGARPCRLDCGRFVVEPLWALNIVIALNTLVIP